MDTKEQIASALLTVLQDLERWHVLAGGWDSEYWTQVPLLIRQAEAAGITARKPAPPKRQNDDWCDCLQRMDEMLAHTDCSLARHKRTWAQARAALAAKPRKAS